MKRCTGVHKSFTGFILSVVATQAVCVQAVFVGGFVIAC
jgi:hypothetical protein